jgi:O-antigen/teichoic acid export membrane protein
MDSLPKKVSFVSVATTLVALLLFIAVIKPLVLIVYTDKFADVVSLSMLTAFGSASFGLGDYINRFLGAHGKGKELRNGAFIVGAVNIAGYSALVILLGVVGAALTQLLAGIVYLLTMMNYYRRFRSEKLRTDTITAH